MIDLRWAMAGGSKYERHDSLVSDGSNLVVPFIEKGVAGRKASLGLSILS